ncbi:unnamed protein product [Gulo gulo]|uniref:Uncharacterized protein n=1 Tax=Gulo gulo TaxID=48420 RepID=A0A9X9LY47_GULGU|nr:unnamed protein product [Gulo gulo]
MFYIQCVSQRTCLWICPFLEQICFKITHTSSNNQDSTVSLRCACNYVFDKDSVTWSDSDSDGPIVFAGLEFPQGDINGDTMLTLTFQFIQDPGKLERALPCISILSQVFQ